MANGIHITIIIIIIIIIIIHFFIWKVSSRAIVCAMKHREQYNLTHKTVILKTKNNMN